MKSKNKSLKLCLSFLGTISLGASITSTSLLLNNNNQLVQNNTSSKVSGSNAYEEQEGDIKSFGKREFLNINSKLSEVTVVELSQKKLQGFLVGNGALQPVLNQLQESEHDQCFLGDLTGFAYTRPQAEEGKCIITCVVYVGTNITGRQIPCYITLTGFKRYKYPEPSKPINPNPNVNGGGSNGQNNIDGNNGLEEKSNSGLYIGLGVGGGILLLAIIALILVMFMKKKKQQTRQVSRLSANNKQPMKNNLLGGPTVGPNGKPGPNGPMGSPNGPRPGMPNNKPNGPMGGPTNPMGGPKFGAPGPNRPGMARPTGPLPPKVEVNAPPKSLAPKVKR